MLCDSCLWCRLEPGWQRAWRKRNNRMPKQRTTELHYHFHLTQERCCCLASLEICSRHRLPRWLNFSWGFLTCLQNVPRLMPNVMPSPCFATRLIALILQNADAWRRGPFLSQVLSKSGQWFVQGSGWEVNSLGQSSVILSNKSQPNYFCAIKQLLISVQAIRSRPLLHQQCASCSQIQRI